MSRLVIDASVAIKWFLNEVHAQEARLLLNGGHDLLVPALLFEEFANILWKRVRRSEMTQDEAMATFQALNAMPLEVHSGQPLVPAALEIACRTDRTVYDSLYLALAIREGALLVTADQRLYHALQNTPLAPHVVWIESTAGIR